MVLWVLLSQTLLIFKVRCFEDFLGADLKSLGAKVKFKPYFSESEGCFPCCGRLHQRWKLQRGCISISPTYSDVHFFLVCLMCRSHSASFWISFRENCSLYSCRFGVSLVGGKLWIPLHCYQELELLKVFYYQIIDNLIIKYSWIILWDMRRVIAIFVVVILIKTWCENNGLESFIIIYFLMKNFWVPNLI